MWPLPASPAVNNRKSLDFLYTTIQVCEFSFPRFYFYLTLNYFLYLTLFLSGYSDSGCNPCHKKRENDRDAKMTPTKGNRVELLSKSINDYLIQDIFKERK